MTVASAVRTALALVALLVIGIAAGWAIRSATESSGPAAPPPRETAPPKPRPPRRHAEPEPAPEPPPVALPPIELPPVAPAVAREVVGRVVLLPRRTSVAGARVELWTGSPSAVSPCDRSATTGEDGVFRFARCESGYYCAVAHVEGLGSRRAAGTVSTGAGADLGDVVFGDGGVLEGRALGPGGPRAGSTVAVCRGGVNGMRTTALTDEQGAYRFGDLEPGKYAVCLDLGTPHARFGPTVVVEAGKSVRCDFAPAARLTGRVTLDGVAVDAGHISVKRPGGPDTSVRIEQGVYCFEDLEPGAGTVQVRVDGVFSLPVRALTLPSGDTTLDIQLGEGEWAGEISGHATLPADRRPDQKLFVGVSLVAATAEGTSNSTSSGYADLDENADFRIRGLGAGRYRLSLMRSTPPGIGDNLGNFDVDLRAGERKTGVDVHPELPDLGAGRGRAGPEEPAMAEIRGRVFAKATGKPLAFPDVNLTLYNHSGDGKTPRVVGTGIAASDGRFTIRASDVERLCLFATPNVGSLREKQVHVEVAAGGRVENLEVALEPMTTGKVAFTVKNEQGRPVRMAHFVELLGGAPAPSSSWGGDSPTGVYQRDIEVGTHVIRVGTTETELSGQTTVEVLEGETTKVEVVLHPRN